ncbi:MAG TPA: DUF934 domain-containing protein [Steroidobacteraceae bacterium]|nr:DUF934 domain-containing protein [Steroidobacteraceae bacterium]
MSARILRRRALIEDDWQVAPERTADLPPGARIIVPLARFRAEREALIASAAAVGVLLANTEDVELVYPEIRDRPLIALLFPTFADGRALSQAAVLRNRLGYAGELRAVGDVVRDLVFWLARGGFDSIAPRADQDLEACRLALDQFSAAYQAAADGRTPVWVQRRTQAAR